MYTLLFFGLPPSVIISQNVYNMSEITSTKDAFFHSFDLNCLTKLILNKFGGKK